MLGSTIETGKVIQTSMNVAVFAMERWKSALRLTGQNGWNIVAEQTKLTSQLWI
jgi:hypothetical protein